MSSQWGLRHPEIPYSLLRSFFRGLHSCGVYNDDLTTAPPKSAFGPNDFVNGILRPHYYLLSLRAARPETILLYVQQFLEDFVLSVTRLANRSASASASAGKRHDSDVDDVELHPLLLPVPSRGLHLGSRAEPFGTVGDGDVRALRHAGGGAADAGGVVVVVAA